MILKNIYFFILLFFLPVFFAPFALAREDVTYLLSNLGNPYQGYWRGNASLYANNIWDMIGFHEKIYFGSGNSSNSGPRPNAGPAPIFVWDTKQQIFEPVFMTSDEQVDAFYSLNNTLMVPGNDPRESWQKGNLYISNDGLKWLKKRTIPGAIHTFALTEFNNQLVAGLGTSKGGAVAFSSDKGNSWSVIPIKQLNRIYDFLVLNNHLFALGHMIVPPPLPQEMVIEKEIDHQIITAEFADSTTVTFRHDLSISTFMPDTSLKYNTPYRIRHCHHLNGKALYIGCQIHNDPQCFPLGLFQANSLTQDKVSVSKVSLPTGVLPWDIYKYRGALYVLLNKLLPNGKYEASVLRSTDLEHWEELFFFTSPGLIRSLALLNDNFYFSIGSEIDNPKNWHQHELNLQTGEIIKLNTKKWQHDFSF